MSKYKLIFDGELEEDVFDSAKEADAYGLYLQSCVHEGAEILHMSNPGDYEYDEDSCEAPEYTVVEIDD